MAMNKRALMQQHRNMFWGSGPKWVQFGCIHNWSVSNANLFYLLLPLPHNHPHHHFSIFPNKKYQDYPLSPQIPLVIYHHLIFFTSQISLSQRCLSVLCCLNTFLIQFGGADYLLLPEFSLSIKIYIQHQELD